MSIQAGLNTRIIRDATNMETRVCNKCNQSLPIKQFSKRRQRSKTDGHWINGYYGQCRNCIAERKAAWRKAHPDYMKEYHEKHKVLKDKIAKTCPYCGKVFETNKPNQVRCKKDCKPLTPIRELKAYLKNHPDIIRKEFFKERYKARYKGRYAGRYKEKARQYRINHKEQIRERKRVCRAKKRARDIIT